MSTVAALFVGRRGITLVLGASQNLSQTPSGEVHGFGSLRTALLGCSLPSMRFISSNRSTVHSHDARRYTFRRDRDSGSRCLERMQNPHSSSIAIASNTIVVLSSPRFLRICSIAGWQTPPRHTGVSNGYRAVPSHCDRAII